MTPATRTSLAPTLPTIAEATDLTDFGVLAWQGIFGPVNLPSAIVERLSTEPMKLITPKQMQERIFFMGADPVPQGPEEFKVYVKGQLAVLERQIKIACVEPQ